MEQDKARVIGIIWAASNRAGGFIGKAAVLGRKIAGVVTGGVSAGKEMLGLFDKDTESVPENNSNGAEEAVSQSNPVAAQNKSAREPKKPQKVRSQLESKIERLEKENHTLVCQLRQAVYKRKEPTAGICSIWPRAVVPESEPLVTKQELTQMRIQAQKNQSQLAVQVRDLQAQKESLVSDVEKLQSKINGMASQKTGISGRTDALKSELAATRRKLEELRSRAESAQAEHASERKQLQSEKDSLVCEVRTARKEADQSKVRKDAMSKRLAELESEISVLRGGPSPARRKKPVGNTTGTEKQTGLSVAVEEAQATATAPFGSEEVKPSTEAVTQRQQTDVIVEKVGGRKLKSESKMKSGGAEPKKVTPEQAKAADFKNETDREIFLKAFSDFDSPKATVRADAAAAIAGIRHELSSRFLITHIADEPSAYVRQECIKALTALQSREGVGTIERALTDEAAYVRLAAVWGLYHLVGTASIGALTRMLYDRDASVRRRAVICMGWLGGQGGNDGNNYSHKVVSALIRCLGDRSQSIKEAAIDALEAVTGQKMPAPRTSAERLVEQWRQWWKSESSGEK